MSREKQYVRIRKEEQIADAIRVRTEEIPEWTQIRLASAVIRMVKNREKKLARKIERNRQTNMVSVADFARQISV